jgi:hypothetical protein
MALQAERIDLVERVLSFTTLSCSGDAWRNGSMVDIGSQYCCGLQQHSVTYCWGVLPPHPVGANESNVSIFEVRSRPCVSRARYMRDFGLMLMLDTHPNVSLADATTNFTQPYLCYDIPRRWTVNISELLVQWLNANISNVSVAATGAGSVRSWQLTMLLTLQLTSYTDTLSCFNWSQVISKRSIVGER